MASVGVTLTQFQPALKLLTDEMETELYENSPLVAMMPKRYDYGGRGTVLPLLYANAPDAAADDAVAFSTTITGNPSFTEFDLNPPGKQYVRGYLQGVTMAMSNGDKNAVITQLQAMKNAAVNTGRRDMANMMRGTGTGSRGAVGSISTVTITLSDPQQIVNFEKGMRLIFLATDSLSSAIAHDGATVYATVATVNRAAGSFTTDVNTAGWATPVAANYVIVRYGDVTLSGFNVSAGLLPIGVAGWIPFTAPSSTAFYGCDRTQDRTRLGGNRYTGGGAPKVQTLIKAGAMIFREQGKPGHCFMNQEDFADLAMERETKVVIVENTSSDGKRKSKVSFDVIEIANFGTTIKCIADINIPQGVFHMLDLRSDVWEFRSAGQYLKVIDLDGLTFVRVAGQDAYEMRWGGFGVLGCAAPGWNLSGTW